MHQQKPPQTRPRVIEQVQRWRTAWRRDLAIAIGIGALPLLSGVIWSTVVWMGVRQTEAEMNFVALPAGCFEMGSPDSEPDRQPNEGPVHRVCVQDFELGRFEVTQGQWRQVMIWPNEWIPFSFKDNNRPADSVNWNNAQRFVRLMSKFGERHYRLPSEAEWEFAARAGTTTARYWGERTDDGCAFENLADLAWAKESRNVAHANCNDGFAEATAPIGSFKPNPWGLHDMLGNVAEWAEDCYTDDYRDAPTDAKPKTGESCAARVVRGGTGAAASSYTRAASRVKLSPSKTLTVVGVRVVRTAGER